MPDARWNHRNQLPSIAAAGFWCPEIVVWGLIINDRGGNLSGFVDSQFTGISEGCIPGSGGNCFHLIPVFSLATGAV